MELLRHQRRLTSSVSWPADIDRRLNILVRAAAAGGERTSRAEILAALVAAAEVDPEDLTSLLHRYRRLPAEALADDAERDDLPIVPTPGPRRIPHP
ncbi:hypothetical protein ACIRJS_45185 [Streptomyces sp. NPDC102340]|uniref:hypothetical protein n=1 Tax=unclassified Streptomyces TaxID=2593676 RepID=UPI00382C491E